MTDTERIDATELPQDKRIELAKRLLDDDTGGATHLIKLKNDARVDEFDATPRTITTMYRGDSRAAALGRAYQLRDHIEHYTDATVNCELTGREYEFPTTIYYEVDIHVNGGDD